MSSPRSNELVLISSLGMRDQPLLGGMAVECEAMLFIAGLRNTIMHQVVRPLSWGDPTIWLSSYFHFLGISGLSIGPIAERSTVSTATT